MKKLILFLFVLISFLNCSRNSENLIQMRFQDSINAEMNDSIKANFVKGEIEEKPIVYIDGEKFHYDKEIDTITLPFNEKQLNGIIFLKANVSMKIYGEEGKFGAIVITTNE